MIAEPTLEYYFYYVRRFDGDSGQAVGEHRAVFAGELRSLLAYLPSLTGQSVPAWEWPQESRDRHISQCILHTDWLDNSATGRSCFLEARTYGDVYCLQVGYYQAGVAGPEIFVSLRDVAWQPSATNLLLGSSCYLCGITADDMDDLAAQMLVTDGKIGGMVSACQTNDRVWLYGSPQQPYTTAVFYPDTASELWASRNLLNDIALRLELYKHKVDRQLGWCEQSWSTLSEEEETLRELAEQVKATSQADAGLLRRLVRFYRVYSINIGMLAERQTTIEANINNLEVVLKELAPLAQDHLLGSTRDRLRQRLKQLETDLQYADRTRQQAYTIINTLRVELALDHLVSFKDESSEMVPIDSSDFPGIPLPVEGEIEPLVPRAKPSQPVLCPQIKVSPNLLPPPTSRDEALLQQVYRGFGQVFIEKEFSGGYSGARVFLVQPADTSGVPTLREITKLGYARALRQERDEYLQHVEKSLQRAARVHWDRYSEQDNWAALSYHYVGDGVLGQTVDLEEYYRRAELSHSAEQLVSTLGDLLEKDLGWYWYRNSRMLQCFFDAEYGQYLIEHLRLKLRPKSSDVLWLEGQPPVTAARYRSIDVRSIPHEHETIQPGTRLLISGMMVKKIKDNEVKLQDPDGLGIVVRVEFDSGSYLPAGLELESRVGVRGEVVYNRRGRMEQIVIQAFPNLAQTLSNNAIALPGVSHLCPNPLGSYSQVLGRLLQARQSYTHGDFHLHNVLVDEKGNGWLIDFAKVGTRHNLFDFIKLETYLRLMILGSDTHSYELDEYVHFERALNEATLGHVATLPQNARLQFAYQIIKALRAMARKYMAVGSDFTSEYFPALFLYSLAMMKYCQENMPQPTRLAFTTASVLACYLPGGGDLAHTPLLLHKGDDERVGPGPTLGTGNRWAVLVGVDEYNDETNYGRLHVCVKDVHAIRERLVSGGFDPKCIRLLDSTEYKPTRAEILAALQSVANATKPDDLLLFYYSGHGDEANDQSYLVAQDGRRLVLQDTAVPIARIKEILERADARAKVIILDACHSGADISGKGAKSMSAEFIRRVFEEAEGLAILASCKQGEVSYEWASQERSVFTHFMLEALQGQADRDDKGFVTVQDTNRYVTDGVKLWASQRNASQTPTLQCTVAGDIILVRYS